jgi:methylated-DNA-[protein]-cysteine S-methyltransferase
VGELWLDGERVVWHECPTAGRPVGANRPHPLVDRLVAYFAGVAETFADVELDLDELTPFQRSLASALKAVPRGDVVSYGELAARAGRPAAQRAAGSFCAQNRHPIFIPCHRVVASGGPGSYGALGLDYKRRLLALEGVAI